MRMPSISRKKDHLKNTNELGFIALLVSTSVLDDPDQLCVILEHSDQLCVII